MKRVLFTMLQIVSFLNSNAQPANSISGRVKDTATGNPLAFVTVELNQDSVVVKSSFSDSAGTYIFSGIPAGSYFISFSRAGYTKAVSPIFIVSGTAGITVKEQMLSTEVKQLSEVTVVSKKPLIEKKADGVVYNVQQDLPAAGGTAADVLRKTPLVTVGQDGSPSIRGSSNIRVFIDDKPSEIYASSVADALQQIPAEQIVKVEVILYPSAKYDAEGTDGVINIITQRKTQNGMNGTANTSQGNIYRNLIASLNIRRQKWIFNIDAGSYLYNNRNGSKTSRDEFSKSLLLQDNEWKNKGQTFYSGVNIIFLIDSLKNIYGGYRFRENDHHTGRISVNDYFVADSLTSSFTRNTFNETTNSVSSFNAGYSGQSKNKSGELKFFTSWFRHHGSNNYNLRQARKESSDYRENSANETFNAELTMQVDYSKKVSAVVNVEAGIKSMNRQSKNSNRFEVYQDALGKFTEDNARASQFSYDRDIYAAYSNVNLSFQSWQVRLGGRYEQTLLATSFGDSSLDIPGYKNFIPSVLINKSITGKHSLKLNYNKQILRPFMVYLNPLINYIDSLNQESGNPYLLPEITHRFDIGYTGNFKKIFAAVTLFYSRNRNSIENIRLPAGNGVFKSTYLNIGKKDALGLSGNISYRDSKLVINTTLNLRYMMLSSAALQVKNNGWQFNGNINASWKFNKGYSIESITNINTADIRLQGTREGWKYYALVLNKKLQEDKLTFSLRAETYNRYITEDFETNEFYQRTDTRYQNLFFGLGISWKFGKKEIKIPATQQVNTE